MSIEIRMGVVLTTFYVVFAWKLSKSFDCDASLRKFCRKSAWKMYRVFYNIINK